MVGFGLAVCLLTAACEGGGAPPSARSLLLITVDTLRVDRIGAYGYAHARTPALDALAAGSVRFERAYAHSSMTLPSMASLLTGRLPVEHGVYGNFGRLPEGMPTLATRLQAAGFATAAFVGNYALRPGKGLDSGFAYYTSEYATTEGVRPYPENPGSLLTERAIAWLDERRPDERWALWIHYQEPHGPYTPPDFEARAQDVGPVLSRSATQSGRGAIPRYQWLGHGRLAEYMARYDGEIAEVDRQLARLLEALSAHAELDRVVLLFTADHGEAFGEEGLFCAHGEGLGEVLLHIPLLLRAPGHSPEVRTDVVRLIDVMPTVLALLGFEDDALPGTSLLVDVGDRPVVAQIDARLGRWRSVREGDLELVQEAPRQGVPNERDSGTVEPGAQGAERALLEAKLERLAPWPARGPRDPGLSPREREALRTLGYLD
jgi:arylsulfatase